MSGTRCRVRPLKLDSPKRKGRLRAAPVELLVRGGAGLENLNVLGLPALLPLHHLELNRLPFKEAAPSSAVNAERSLTTVT